MITNTRKHLNLVPRSRHQHAVVVVRHKPAAVRLDSCVRRCHEFTDKGAVVVKYLNQVLVSLFCCRGNARV